MSVDLELRNAYIGLLKNAILNRLYGGEVAPPSAEDLETCASQLEEARKHFGRAGHSDGSEVDSALSMTPERYYYFLRLMASDRNVHTMTTESGVDNLIACARDVLENDIRGDFIETGVWKGGLTILMRGILKAYGKTDRRVWVADSFRGVPPPSQQGQRDDAIAHFLAGPIAHLAVGRREVEANFARYGLLDQQVEFLEGLFADTLPSAPLSALALARLDGDLYESTMDALVNLYPKVTIGGYVIIDDYGLPLGCRAAVDEYRTRHGVGEVLQWVNEATVFWRKRS